MSNPFLRGGSILVTPLVCLAPAMEMPAAAQEQVVVEAGSAMRFWANDGGGDPPPFGMDWTTTDFDDGAWDEGTYGVGYESGSGAQNLIQTAVPTNTVTAWSRSPTRTKKVSVACLALYFSSRVVGSQSIALAVFMIE